MYYNIIIIFGDMCPTCTVHTTSKVQINLANFKSSYLNPSRMFLAMIILLPFWHILLRPWLISFRLSLSSFSQKGVIRLTKLVMLLSLYESDIIIILRSTLLAFIEHYRHVNRIGVRGDMTISPLAVWDSIVQFRSCQFAIVIQLLFVVGAGT